MRKTVSRRTSVVDIAAAVAVSAIAFAMTPARAADLSEVPSGTYVQDPQHAYLIFSYTHLGFSRPKVRFDDFDVSLELDSEQPERSEIVVTIDVSSVDSGVEVFDGHLLGEEYFDLANHRTITFASTAIEQSGPDTYEITGDLTIRDRTNPITLSATVNGAGQHPLKKKPAVGISASGALKRSAWGLDNYVPMVSDEVELTIEVEMVAAGGE